MLECTLMTTVWHLCTHSKLSANCANCPSSSKTKEPNRFYKAPSSNHVNHWDYFSVSDHPGLKPEQQCYLQNPPPKKISFRNSSYPPEDDHPNWLPAPTDVSSFQQSNCNPKQSYTLL